MGLKLNGKVSWGRALLKTVGVGESKGWSTLFLVFTILGLVPNFVVLLGCMVKQTEPIHLFRVSSLDLLDATTNATSVSLEDLDIPELPDHWSWGLSGLCATHRNDDVVCQRAFPPLYTTEEMVSFGINTHSSTDRRKAASLLRPWSKALSQLDPSLERRHASSTTTLRAAAALAVLSTLLGLGLGGLALAALTVWHDKPPRWALYLLAVLDGGMLTGAGALAICAMDGGPRAVIAMSGIAQGSEGSFVGPGFFALFAGALLKFVSVGVLFVMVFSGAILLLFLVWCCAASCRRNKDDDARSDEVPFYSYPGQATYA